MVVFDNRRQGGIDYYPTPSWCVHRLLEAVDLPSGNWLEPAVGDGSIIRAVNEISKDGILWTGVDIRPECLTSKYGRFIVGDFIDMACSMGSFDVVITNPPYSRSLDFVQASIGISDVVVMLLRLNWLSSAKRYELLNNFMPDVYVLPNRPSFDGNGVDSTDYAWMVWKKAERSQCGKIVILDKTSVSIRKNK